MFIPASFSLNQREKHLYEVLINLFIAAGINQKEAENAMTALIQDSIAMQDLIGKGQLSPIPGRTVSI